MMSEKNTKSEKYESFHHNGNRHEEVLLLNGKLEGHYKQWHQCGRIRTRAFYRDNERVAEYTYWIINGQLMQRIFYRDGKSEGEYKFWSHDGSIWQHIFYRNGKMVTQLNESKKIGFLRIKKLLMNRNNLLDSFIISDLAKIACL